MNFGALWPLPLYFLCGLLLQKSRLAARVNAARVFRVVFLVTIPALAFASVSRASLGGRSALLPAIGFCINMLGAAAAMLYGRVRRLSPVETGTIVLGAGIANNLFVFTFIFVMLGPDALAKAFILDVGNALFVATVATSVATRYGSDYGQGIGRQILKVLRTPMFVALALAVAVNLGSLQLHDVFLNAVGLVGSVTVPLTVFALGLSFSLAGYGGHAMRATVALRMGFGLVLGVLAAGAFGGDSATSAVIVASGAAPVGFTAATFASIGRLDTRVATQAISASVLIGLVSTPLLLALVPHLL